MTVPLRPSHPPLRLTFLGRVARRSACVLAAVERLSLPVGRSQRRDAGACCVRAWPRPFPSPSPSSLPGPPPPAPYSWASDAELPPPRSIFFFSPQPATACALPPAASSRSAGQLQPDKGTRGTRGLAYTREGYGRAQAAERIPAPRKLRAPPSRRSPRRSRGKLSP